MDHASLYVGYVPYSAVPGVVGDDHVPLDDGEGIVLGKLATDVRVQVELVELHRRAFRVHVFLNDSHRQRDRQQQYERT